MKANRLKKDLSITLRIMEQNGYAGDWTKDELEALAMWIATLHHGAGIGITDTLRIIYQKQLIPTKTQKEMFQVVRTMRVLQAA